jgi:hypothetical protein
VHRLDESIALEGFITQNIAILKNVLVIPTLFGSIIIF